MRKSKPKYKKIIEAATVVIAENGFQQAHVSKIAKRAGVADGTVYLYFKNKEDILLSLFEDKITEFLEEMSPDIDRATKATDKLRVFVEGHFSRFSNNPHFAMVTQLELRHSDKEVRRTINKILKDYLSMIDKILKLGIENGEFDPQLDVKVTRRMVFGVVDDLMTNWVMNDQNYDIMELTDSVYQFVSRGCGVVQKV
ncbi:TetR/AcrR family transcriptional regulator [Brevibacillus laterosporus]|uniref:TetR/AcrR family transcriptional regulator n=1 Tax=Brevibacillus laterosporus TaxID=1465 RepID=UPI003D1CD020